MNHPNIATLFDLQEHDGVHFLVLELVPGETLAERIKRGRLPVDEAMTIALQIAEALELSDGKVISLLGDLEKQMTFLTGHSGAGKSTVGRALATQLGVGYLDTGAMYRTVALLALRAGLREPLEPTAGTALRELMEEHDIAVSVDRDGTMSGGDLALADKVSQLVDIPVIYAGGISGPENCAELGATDISALGIASIFHFTSITPRECKIEMNRHNIAVRLN